MHHSPLTPPPAGRAARGAVVPVLQPVRLDAYCAQCADQRCDIDHDCGLLKYRRREQVRACLPQAAGYLDAQHGAVPTRTLVEVLFPNTTVVTNALAARYLVDDYARLLSDTLGRDRRFVRQGDAWALRGSVLAAFPVTSGPGARSRERQGEEGLSADIVAAARDHVRAAARPVSTETLAREVAGDARLAEPLARALRDGGGDVRPVAVDPRTSLVTLWATTTWLAARLPLAEDELPPVSITARHAGMTSSLATARAMWADVRALSRDGATANTATSNVDDGDENPDDATETQVSDIYIITMDDMFCGSIMLREQDHALFPDEPVPAYVELRDEWGGSHDGVVVRAPDHCELFGLRPFLLARGGVGLSLRLLATDLPSVLGLAIVAANVDRIEMSRTEPPTTTISGTSEEEEARRGEADDEERELRVSVARRLWDLLLKNRAEYTVRALATMLGVDDHHVRTALRRYRCFECEDMDQERWRLSSRWPGLRRHFLFTDPGPGGLHVRKSQVQALDEGMDARVARLIEEVAAMTARARQLHTEAEMVKRDASALAAAPGKQGLGPWS